MTEKRRRGIISEEEVRERAMTDAAGFVKMYKLAQRLTSDQQEIFELHYASYSIGKNKPTRNILELSRDPSIEMISKLPIINRLSNIIYENAENVEAAKHQLKTQAREKAEVYLMQQRQNYDQRQTLEITFYEHLQTTGTTLPSTIQRAANRITGIIYNDTEAGQYDDKDHEEEITKVLESELPIKFPSTQEGQPQKVLKRQGRTLNLGPINLELDIHFRDDE